jgi:signal transduction histidine kinase/ActR/RegA family two-component response regulator
MTTAPGSAPITLATRRSVLACLVLAVLCVAGVWATEAALGQLQPSDAKAYPALIVWFGGLALLLAKRPRRLLLVQRLASLGLGLYFVASVSWLLLGSAEPSVYTIASLTCWLVAAQLFLFITWPPGRAAVLSLLLALLVLLPSLGVDAVAWPHWRPTLWPLLVNGLFAQLFFGATLYGAGRQLQKLALLVPAPDADMDTEAVLTVDDVLRLRLLDLERARDAAEAASLAKSRFLAVMSHELRTPLHGVLGAAELLRRPGDSEGQRLAWVDTVQRGGQHLLRLIEDMLDLSRIEAGRLDLAQQPVDLRRCMAQAIESLQPLAQAKGLHLTQDVAAAVPDWVRGDTLRLTQVLMNLLGNAVKFTDHGEVVLRARLDARRAVRIEVQDSGIGIAAADQERIFESFVQADGGSTRRHGGSGLGLAITQQLVTLMGGRIRLESEPGRGTLVELLLPLTACAAPPPAQPPDRPADAADLAGVSLLLVDDDAVNITIASHMLRNLQAQVACADSGEAALRLLARQPFDAVLMDWRMPGMDGLEATRRLRAGAAGDAARCVPVLGLTASAFDDDRAACLAAGMNDVLVKPVDSATLLRAVQGQLQRVQVAPT